MTEVDNSIPVTDITAYPRGEEYVRKALYQGTIFQSLGYLTPTGYRAFDLRPIQDGDSWQSCNSTPEPIAYCG